MTLLGIISDTHGLLRPKALDALRGSELIIHAGDVGKSEILERLREIAPVVAVRGNVDTAPWAQDLPETDMVEIGGRRIFVLHDRSQLAFH
jgi:putative phosphoesterase